MESRQHQEPHFQASDTVRDIVIGMSDGLTVPFAIAAGLSGVGASTTIVVTGGLSEIAAGAIAMGLGGYLAARTDMEHYNVERKREQREVEEKPGAERAEVADILGRYGLSDESTSAVLDVFEDKPEKWVDFMMQLELGLDKPEPRRAIQSGLTIGMSYIVGGFIPLTPYIVLGKVGTALPVSVGVTLLALLIFGYVKGRVTGVSALRSGLQTGLVGSLAAGAAFLLARLIG
ncbi:MAG: VIT1/CCC1 transporter family protein [Anaerolineales bacterium]|jgi:VIT1/CCC1 family predicted Fe2+/Mn2+ transporter